jgi:predicted metal-binding protein
MQLHMKEDDLNKYFDHALKREATSVKQIHPSSVVTAPWVRLKCQFGCGGYNYNYCCPPHTPTAHETRRILDCYNRALLFHMETLWSKDREKRLKKFLRTLIDLEEIMFKDGYYKAFVFLAGPCELCKECGKIAGTFCTNSDRARPSMEACGIDVFQTVRNNGFRIETLHEETEPRNTFCLMLVD